MKFNITAPTVETSKELEEKVFAIGDAGIVFDVLRSKMYSNPISAICREISCNARDAHREVGTPNVPIEIYLPNYIEPYFKIKDYGPGISPDRIENIYIKYGSSSKRNDNSQTGMYGLGAKTPFSYSDTFTISTTHNNIKYNYSCIIDETKVGKLILLDKAPTDDHNGTEIIIPVKSTDFKSYAQWIEHATRHWEIKPLFKGGDIIYNTFSKVLSGKGWDLLSNKYGNDSNVKFIIDDIEYLVNINTLSSFIDTSIITSVRSGTFVLYFSIGQISLSANREQVFLDKQTQACIKQRFDDISNEIKSVVISKIDKCENLWDANVFYSQELSMIFHNLKFLGSLTYKGYKLNYSSIQIHTDCIFNYSKGKSYPKLGPPIDKLKKYSSSNIYFNKNTSLVINDLFIKDPSSKHFKELMFDLLKTKDHVLLITPDNQAELDRLNQTYHLDAMAHCSLSSICKKPLVKVNSILNKLIVFKASPKINQIAYALIKEDNNKKVLCTFNKDKYNKNNKIILLNNNKIIKEDELVELVNSFKGYSFYLISNTYSKDLIDKAFPNYQSLDSFLDEKIKEFESTTLMKVAYAYYINNNNYIPYTNYNDHYYELIVNKDNSLIKLLNLKNELSTLYKDNKIMMAMHRYIASRSLTSDECILTWIKDNPEFNLFKLTAEVKSKYKILNYLDMQSYNLEVVKVIAEYINLIDEKEVKNV